MNQQMLCSRCKKRMAVVFITRMEGDKSVNEGLCLKCAKELNIKPVTDLMDKMGITDEQLDAMDDQMNGLLDSFGDSFDMGGAQSMPFMQMFNMPAQRGEEDEEEDGEYPQDELADGQMEPYESGEEQESQMGGARNLSAKERRQQEKERKKYKFLSAHCENLTLKAKDGKIDRIVGRDKEIERVIQILNRRTKNNPCLIGEPGVGKTAIAEGIAQRLADGNVPVMLQGKELYLLDMTSLVAGTQFRGQFESRVKGLLDDVRKVGNAILFIDEVHRLPRTVEEILYPAMEDYALDIIVGKGPSANSIRLDLPKFTLIGATTRSGQLSAPLRDRFGVTLRLELYTPEELSEIVTRSAGILNVDIVPEGAYEIARRSRGTPRIANRMLRRVRDFAQVKADGVITKDVADQALCALEIDHLGLDPIDRRMLGAIIENYGGGPVGLETLAATIGEESVTLEDVYEPYLMQLGFLTRTPRGRCVTQKAYQHLHLPIPGGMAPEPPDMDQLTL